MTTVHEELTGIWPSTDSRETRVLGRARGGIQEGPLPLPGVLVDGRYQVRREIGHGGMGSVLEVEDTTDGTLRALKWCRLEGHWLKRFAREVRLMERVRHPNVVPVTAANLEASPPYFVMPLAVKSLEDELPDLVGNEAQALGVFRQVCLGVRAIHESGVVHRDIKPANILRLESGRVVVSDLGVAKLESRDSTVLTKTRAVVGTLGFLAPEQLLPAGSRRADVRTDIYQLGKVLYQLLTGRPPALIEPDAVPRGLAHIVLRATSVNPNDRYRDIGELLDALRYYQLAQDPARNAREALESLVLQAEELLRRREYRAQNVREILALLAPLDRLDSAAAIERFDRLPEGLLPVLAGEFSAEFLPIARAYASAVREKVASFPFRYADAAARRMRLMFLSTADPGLKTTALLATLIAAVQLNRYAAMHVFNGMLKDVHDVELALPIAEMLRAHSEFYERLADAVPPDRLHPAVRAVQQVVLSRSERAE